MMGSRSPPSPQAAAGAGSGGGRRSAQFHSDPPVKRRSLAGLLQINAPGADSGTGEAAANHRRDRLLWRPAADSIRELALLPQKPKLAASVEKAAMPGGGAAAPAAAHPRHSDCPVLPQKQESESRCSSDLTFAASLSVSILAVPDAHAPQSAAENVADNQAFLSKGTLPADAATRSTVRKRQLSDSHFDRHEEGATSPVTEQGRVRLAPPFAAFQSDGNQASAALSRALPIPEVYNVQARRLKIVELTERMKKVQNEVKDVQQCRELFMRRRQDIVKHRQGGVKKANVVDLIKMRLALGRREESLFRHMKTILAQVRGHRKALPFLIPVDAALYDLRNYYMIIRRPMDLATIHGKLESKSYQNVRQVCEDVRLVFENAMTYHESKTELHRMAVTLSKYFDKKWRLLEPQVIDVEARSCRQALFEESLAQVQKADEQAIRLCEQLDEAERELETVCRSTQFARDCVRGPAHAARSSWGARKGCKQGRFLLENSPRPISKAQREAILWSLYTALKRTRSVGAGWGKPARRNGRGQINEVSDGASHDVERSLPEKEGGSC